LLVSLESDIDSLYRLPLGQFTAARNALAKTLTGADASRVKRLEKPTLVPWAINQLYWKDRAAYDRLMKSGAALRSAQIGALEGKKADTRRAGDAHRQALAAAVDRAVKLAGSEGGRPAGEPLARMLESLSIAPEPPAHPGRWTDLVQPAGFEALTGITPVPGAAVPPPPKPVPPKPRLVVDREAMKRAEEARQEEARRRERQMRIATAERALERARSAEARAREALAQAEAEVRTAEAALARAKR
jgi:hypothetical protein